MKYIDLDNVLVVTDAHLDMIDTFVKELQGVLCNNNTPLSEKQKVFTNTYEIAFTYINKLQRMIDNLFNDKDKTVDEQDTHIIERASDIIKELHQTILSFKEELMIDKDVQTEDTIEHKYFQAKEQEELKEEMHELALVPPLQANECTHMLILNKQMYLVKAKDKKELEEKLNEVIDEVSNVDDIQLYKMTLETIPVQLKTVVTV